MLLIQLWITVKSMLKHCNPAYFQFKCNPEHFQFHPDILQNAEGFPLSQIFSFVSNTCIQYCLCQHSDMDRVKRIWYLSPMQRAKVQASLRIHTVLPEPSLLTHTSSESRGTFTQKARSLAPLNGWACTVKISHDRMLEDTNSLDGAHITINWLRCTKESGQFFFL